MKKCNVPENPALSQTAVMRGFRLGNCLIYKDKLVKIEAITNEYFSVSGYEYNRFTPVKLNDNDLNYLLISSESLLKLDFVKKDYGHDTFYWKLNILTITDRPTDVFDEEGRFIDTNYKTREYSFTAFNGDEIVLKYIHQIQNIAFDLYGYVLNLA